MDQTPSDEPVMAYYDITWGYRISNGTLDGGRRRAGHTKEIDGYPNEQGLDQGDRGLMLLLPSMMLEQHG